MTARDYDFDGRMAMSNGVCETASIESILMQEIPGALSVHAAGDANDRNGTDWWVEHSSGRHLSIDAKVRDEDWSRKSKTADDLALETWSVIERGVVGWTRNESKRTDYILWLWKDTGRWCLVSFPMLCRVFQVRWQEWSQKYKTARQHTPDRGYHSECVFVPRREVWAEMYRHYAGSPQQTAVQTT